MNDKINLWAFYHNPMIWESVASIISYHKTKEGAEKAMKAHKRREKYEHDKMYKNEDLKELKGSMKYSDFKSWFVQEFELEILP